MNPQLTDVYKKSAEKALDWLLLQLKPDGSYGSAINDLACYYKSPNLFYISGRIAEAKRTLIHIQHAYMQSNGDFMTFAGIKSANGTLAEYRAYTNGWIALAAQKMGSFDVAYPAYRYLSSFCHKLGFGICKLTIRRKAAPVVHLLE